MSNKSLEEPFQDQARSLLDELKKGQEAKDTTERMLKEIRRED